MVTDKVSDIYLRHLHRNYRHYYRHITAKKKFTPTFTPTKLHQPSAFTDQQLIWLLSQNYPKRERTRRFKEKRVLHLLYTEINVENSGHNIIEYQQLKSFIMQVEAISLCKLRHFHCASCGYFIMQVVAISLCKLRIYTKKMVFHSSKWNTIDLNFMLIIEFRN